MSTTPDKNYKSYDGPQEDVTGVLLDPIADGWEPGSWQDTCKFWRRERLLFTDFTIVHGGTEDGIDCSSRNVGNIFRYFTVAAGDKYVMTLKGSSKNNTFRDWVITKPGKFVDIQIGNWSDDDVVSPYPALSTGNIFERVSRADGQPVRYAYRYGCKPVFFDSYTKHLWWMSAGLTAYWYAKYLIVKAFK